MDLNQLTIKGALLAIERKEFAPIDLTNAVLERIDRLNPRLNCYLNVYRDAALEQAREKTNRWHNNKKALTALFGIPMGLKDLFAIRNLPLRAGSLVWQNNIPKEDAFVVQKLRRAGAIFIGHQNMHEIALGVTTVNPHYGACHNPWNLERISGGSSGGSAVAVASSLCLGALGTDTGGSIRIPAGLCGVVGFKPTFGRVSVRGVLPLSWNLDHVGPLAKCVEDAAILYHVIAGYDDHDPYSAPKSIKKTFHPALDSLQGVKIALVSDDFFTDADPEVIQAVRNAAAAFEKLGAIVEECAFPDGLLAAQTNSQMVISDAAALYEQDLNAHPELFGEDILQRLRNGVMVTSSQYVHARHTQTILRKKFNDFFRNYDILLTPTTPITAPLIQGENALERAKTLTRFTAPFNLSGLPALTMPCGFDSQGLPIGLQLVTRAWNEEKLLQVAYIYEQSAGWWQRRPAL